jgi:hypothetical protein
VLVVIRKTVRYLLNATDRDRDIERRDAYRIARNNSDITPGQLVEIAEIERAIGQEFKGSNRRDAVHFINEHLRRDRGKKTYV